MNYNFMYVDIVLVPTKASLPVLVSMQEVSITIYDSSVGHCTYGNVLHDSKYAQNTRNIEPLALAR